MYPSIPVKAQVSSNPVKAQVPPDPVLSSSVFVVQFVFDLHSVVVALMLAELE